ncbi:MAG: hemerythrin domain-containing protein [Flavobacteriales bacterium]|nr:hemerythrin domain-containing protein [Flavobacteriales bacterium]
MKIIDPTTGKRIDGRGPSELDLKKLKHTDPLQREVEKEINASEHSPMDPPDAYGGQVIDAVAYEEMPALLQRYMDEHRKAEAQIHAFEEAMARYKETGYKLDPSINETFRAFFTFFDDKVLDHNRREERQLFPLLHRRLVESGERSTGPAPTTAVDLMEDDHVKFIQLGALAFNLLGLAARLPDDRSAMFTYDAAYDASRELTEALRLHIHREDNILFPLACKLIDRAEMDRLAS